MTRRPRTPQSGGRFDRTSWNKAVMVLNVAIIGGLTIVGLTYVSNTRESGTDAVASPPPSVASTLAQPDEDSASPEPTDVAAPASEAPTAPAQASAPAPKVPLTMRSDFSSGDAWPVGAGFREAGTLAWPLGVVDGLMTHGAARSPDAVSWLEKWTKADVRRIGARVVFAPNHSGSAALTAWHTSILDLDGQATPRTGMRLVVTPSGWRLVAVDGRAAETIGSGTYTLAGRSARFDLVRKADTVWVTDPSGTVTSVSDPRVASLSGPWASWELRDARVGTRPAGFAEVWAG
ncbi:hypothetical protein G5V58_19430 [Nocardioides anomalus]|uniref:Uncharacterized protein n=1 Tax=Nocardioides anomalus TaxID=2712223 RepID=A0A6G6WHX5_9ACTN|nr:hypothetical protein [Nocardioides anomalus]QIG44660.1 hypothetical protein G5V58_19430 [Nocardioides anomalus]